MTKRQPFVTGLRLSKICRWLMALGLVKVGILVALAAGYPLPELSFDFFPVQETKSVASAPEIQTVRTETLVLKDNLKASEAIPDAPQVESLAQVSTPTSTQEGQTGEPQGSAAARAAAALTAKSSSASGPSISIAPVQVLSPVQPANTAEAPSATLDEVPATKAETAVSTSTAEEQTPSRTVAAVADTTWWNNILQVKSLPFPRLGIDQAAHAATLDAPPPPSLPAASPNSSPFVPPQQVVNIPSGQNPDGSPIAPRSTTARPLPAGTAGPQASTPVQDPMSTLLVPNTNPPAPKVDTYVAPEDPNRQKQELARREQEILMLKKQMEQRLQELQAAERKVQGMLEEAKDVEAKKVSNLSAMYVNMKPKQAAKALENMDERIAVKILSSMSPKQSGEILTYTDPAKTAKFTEIISRMRLGQ